MTTIFQQMRWSILAVFCLSTMAQAAGDAIGKVEQQQGAVHVLNKNTAARPLRMQASVWLGETVASAKQAYVVLRMVDGAAIQVLANSQLQFQHYRYQGESDDGVHLQLLQGGLRTVTGVLGKQSPASYRVGTPVGTLGGHGRYQAEILANGSVRIHVEQGTVSFANQAGVGLIQAGEEALVANRSTPIQIHPLGNATGSAGKPASEGVKAAAS